MGAAARPSRTALERDGSSSELAHITADTYPLVRIHIQIQNRRPLCLLALHDLEPTRPLSRHRYAPPAEIGGGGARRGVLQHRRPLREKEPRQEEFPRALAARWCGVGGA